VVTAIFLAYVINYLISGAIETASWRWMIGVEAIPAFSFFVLLFGMPESPRWMAMNNRKEEAINIFTRIGAANPECTTTAGCYAVLYDGQRGQLSERGA